MNRALSPVLLLSLPLIAGNVRVDLPGGSGGIDEGLTYFNGSPHWLTWGGMYRGTWFNTEDFLPGSTGTGIQQIEYWFFEHASYPWDTDQFYSEIWNGDQTGPQVFIAQGIVTAYHYAPCYQCFEPCLLVGVNFWALINTEMSAGGWPSVLGDFSMPGDAGHSFFSDDFIVWEPWGEMGEYYIIVDCIPGCLLDTTTWGSLKALF